MLAALRVENLAIIDRLEVELGPGLTVLTGETGAGKSILVTALRLVLGARAAQGVVRTGADAAEVEALLDLSDNPAAVARLRAEGIDVDEEVVVRRTVLASGRTRAYINGRLATVGQLARLAHGLVDISSQHAHHTLVDPTTHLAFLDAFADLDAARTQVGVAVASLTDLAAALRALRERVRDRAEREDMLRFQLSEIDALSLTADAFEQWEATAECLRYAEELGHATANAEATLYGRDGAVCDVLGAVVSALSAAQEHDPSLAPVVEAIEGARTELEEAARTLGSYASAVEASPAELAEAEDRLHAVRRLLRRHGCDVPGLLARAQAARDELDTLGSVDADLVAAEAAVSAALAVASEAARALSAKRRAGAGALGDAVTTELRSLGMGAARVEVAVAHRTRGAGFEVDGAQLSATGLDDVEFLIAPNPGEEPRPLRAIASGGELSRALLGVKRVLARGGPIGTYVFDEVDTGVGGAVAEVIGQKLADVAAHHQVLCVTHLAQVAAYADQHLLVRKDLVGGRTVTSITALDADARQEEVARMLGGITVSDITRQAAGELLGRAAAL